MYFDVYFDVLSIKHGTLFFILLVLTCSLKIIGKISCLRLLRNWEVSGIGIAVDAVDGDGVVAGW